MRWRCTGLTVVHLRSQCGCVLGECVRVYVAGFIACGGCALPRYADDGCPLHCSLSLAHIPTSFLSSLSIIALYIPTGRVHTLRSSPSSCRRSGDGVDALIPPLCGSLRRRAVICYWDGRVSSWCWCVLTLFIGGFIVSSCTYQAVYFRQGLPVLAQATADWQRKTAALRPLRPHRGSRWQEGRGGWEKEGRSRHRWTVSVGGAGCVGLVVARWCGGVSGSVLERCGEWASHYSLYMQERRRGVVWEAVAGCDLSCEYER